MWDPTGRLIATATSLQACRFTTGPCGDADGDQRRPDRPRVGRHRPTTPEARALGSSCRATPPEGAASELFPVFSDDGRDVAVIDKVLSSLTVFDSTSGQLRWSRRPGGQVVQAAFAPDGKTLAVAHLDAAGSGVTMFDERNGTPGRELDVNNIFGAAFARGGDVLVTSSGFAGNSSGMQLWDAATLQPIGEPMPSPGLLALLVTPSPDGTKVVTGTGFGTTVLWDLDVHDWETQRLPHRRAQPHPSRVAPIPAGPALPPDLPPMARRGLTPLCGPTRQSHRRVAASAPDRLARPVPGRVGRSSSTVAMSMEARRASRRPFEETGGD